MKTKQPATISDLIEYSHSLLKHAEAGEWDKVIEGEAVRRQLINTYFSIPSNVSDEPEISCAIRELLQINNKLEKLTISVRDEAQTQVSSISNGRRAVSAYVNNAR